MAASRKRAVREILAFYDEAGVDALLGEAPVNRLAAAEPRALPVEPVD
ncbi:MAG: uracil-DNA glycosylase, partial [Pseudorhodoplanes sp.]